MTIQQAFPVMMASMVFTVLSCLSEVTTLFKLAKKQVTSACGHEHEAVLARHGGIDGLALVGPERRVGKEVGIGLIQVI